MAPMKTFSPDLLLRLAAEHGTPYYLYDAEVILAQLAALRGFDVVRFAQKACSNVHVLRLLREAGALVDAVSLGEIERALRAGYDGRGEPAGLVYTADLIDEATLDRVAELDIPVNAGSADVLEQLGRRRPGHRVWLRVNPGFGHGHSRKTNTGGEWSKHGIWHAYLDEALRHVEKYRLDLVGLHMHIGSGADFEHLRPRVRRDGRAGARARRRRARDLGRRRAADPVSARRRAVRHARAARALARRAPARRGAGRPPGEPRDRAGPLPGGRGRRAGRARARDQARGREPLRDRRRGLQRPRAAR